MEIVRKALEEISSFKEAENYILNIPRFGQKSTMEDTRRFLNRVGDISKEVPTIHIAGTNGKGSVCALLYAGLKKADVSTAMFTSPHLVTIRERFLFDGEMISEEEFLHAFKTVLSFLIEEEFSSISYHPSYFEFLFFMAMVWLRPKKPGAVILETGLGGRLDATNSIDSPVLSIITEIGFDHMEYLGNTVEKIAAEKAGIIRPGVPVVFMAKEGSGEVIKEASVNASAPYLGISKNCIKNLHRGPKGIDFSLVSNYYDNAFLSVNSKALYQAENASLAYVSLMNLGQRGIFDIGPEQIKDGFLSMCWPGRMEEICENFYIDGAHNEDGINAFLESVSSDGASRRCLLFSAVSDKQVEKITGMIIESKLFDTIYVAPLQGYRASGIERLNDCFQEFEGKLVSFACVKDALSDLMVNRNCFDVCYAAGSLYLVGEIKGIVK